MYCPKCGAKIDDDSTFCICCGAAVTAGARRKPGRKPENEETAELPRISGPDETGLTQAEKSAPNQTATERPAPVRASSVQPAPKSTMTEKPAPQQSEPVQVTSETQKAPPAAAPVQAAEGGGDAGPAEGRNESAPQRSETPDRTAGNTSAGGSGTSSGTSGPPSRPPEQAVNTPTGTGGTSYQSTRRRIRTNRGWFKLLLLSLITCGIYGLYFTHALARDVNILCEEDGKHTTGLLGLIGLSIVTCGFFRLYWGASIIDRVAANLALQYKIMINATGLKYVLWCIPGKLLLGIGPLIALHTMLKSINQLAVAYNARYGI